MQVQEGNDLIVVRPTKLMSGTYHAAMQAADISAVTSAGSHEPSCSGPHLQSMHDTQEQQHHSTSAAPKGAQQSFAFTDNASSTMQHADPDPACHSVDGYTVDYAGHEPMRLEEAGNSGAEQVPDLLHGRRFARLDSALVRANALPQGRSRPDDIRPQVCFLVRRCDAN